MKLMKKMPLFFYRAEVKQAIIVVSYSAIHSDDSECMELTYANCNLKSFVRQLPQRVTLIGTKHKISTPTFIIQCSDHDNIECFIVRVWTSRRTLSIFNSKNPTGEIRKVNKILRLNYSVQFS